MARAAKICRGSWCFTFGFEPPVPLETVVKVLSAFGYDGIELAGFHDHATLERYPTKAERHKLVDFIKAHNLEIVGYAPGPYGDFGRLPWATGDESVLKVYQQFFADSLQFCVDCGIPAIRVDPGDFGPLPRHVDYAKTWDRVVTTFRQHAEDAAKVGVKVLWEPETSQIFNKPSEIVRLVNDVGHPNFQILYDTGHMQACCVLAHKQVQPMETLPGGQLDLIKQLKGKIGHIHLCDNDNNTYQDAFGKHLGFGKGVLNFDELIPAFLDAGYESDWWSVDAIPMSSESWTDTWDGIRQLREWLGKFVK